MRTIQSRIDDLEKQADAIVTKDLQYVFFSRTNSDGSIFYQVDRGFGKEWINKVEFNEFEDENYKDKSKPIIIFDISLFGGKSGIENN